jgi:hypothetical protein
MRDARTLNLRDGLNVLNGLNDLNEFSLTLNLERQRLLTVGSLDLGNSLLRMFPEIRRDRNNF